MDTGDLVAIGGLILSGFAILIIPAIVMMVRLSVRWTSVENKLGGVIDDVKKIVADKDKVHQEISTAMREDRAATDRRLRWLEEYLWRKGPHDAV